MLAGRYRLDDLLDDIDGARFWRATDTVLARSVAVHVLAETDPRVDALLERRAGLRDGHRPAPAAGARRRPPRRHGLGVNEWGTGLSLDQMLSERRALPPDRAAWVVSEVAEAIAAAHRQRASPTAGCSPRT